MRCPWRGLVAVSLFALAGCTAQPKLVSAPASLLSPTTSPTFLNALKSVSTPLQSFAVPAPTLPPSPTAQISPTAAGVEPTLLPPPASQNSLPGVSDPTVPTLPPPLETRLPALPQLPSPIPLASVHIVFPGPGARLTSPINLQASAIPGDDRTVRIQLIGEDGRALASETQHFTTPHGQRVGLISSLGFKLAGVAEAARLQVSTQDSYGRPVALTSISLVLLSQGTAENAPEGDPNERVILLTPTPGAAGVGGLLPVSGYLLPQNRQPLILELVDETSQILASASLTLSPPTGAYQPFSGALHYQVTAPTRARLILRQPDARLPGDAVLTSVLVLLNP
jgi:hypothetical protein